MTECPNCQRAIDDRNPRRDDGCIRCRSICGWPCRHSMKVDTESENNKIDIESRIALTGAPVRDINARQDKKP
jgi:hypothetical protein